MTAPPGPIRTREPPASSHPAPSTHTLAERYRVLAAAWDRMIAFLTTKVHRERIALVELHNEIDFSILPALADGGIEQVSWLLSRHPDLLVTASYGKPPHLAVHRVPEGIGAAQFHVYSYGVLDALQKRIDIRSEGSAGFPNAELRALLRPDAPTVADYGRAAEWKYRASVVTDQMIYGYDWIIRMPGTGGCARTRRPTGR